MRQAAEHTVVVRPNEIRLVRRRDSDKWQAHYKVHALGRWIRKATKQSDFDKARAVAERMFARAEFLAEEGHPVVSKKFKAVAEVVMQELQKKIALSKTRRGSNNDYINVIKTYLIPFFGKKNIERIDQEVFNEFCDWRTEKVGRELSHSTQLNHNAALNHVFDYAIQSGYMTALQKPYLTNRGEASSRRPVFSVEEYEKLVAYLPTWAAGAREKRSKAIRDLMSVYIPFVGATAMRPGTEMEFLEWRHIEIQRSENAELLKAHILRGKTVKKNKPALMVLHLSCWSLLEKLCQLTPAFKDKTLRDVLAEKPALPVFRLDNGKKMTHPSTQFKDLLKELNLLKCPITGDDRTLYSLRHFAITQLIHKGFTEAQIQAQVRTSSMMISKYYNHLSPLRNAEAFAGLNDNTDAETVSRMLHGSPNDNLMHFAELSTGVTVLLTKQNKDAVDELREELSKGGSQKQG